MKAIIFSLKNIRRNPIRSLLFCFIITILMLLTLLTVTISTSINEEMENIKRSRLSSNMVYASLGENKLENYGINSDEYLENIKMNHENFAGKMLINGVGEFHVMTEIYYTESGNMPKVFEKEYNYIGGNELYLYGKAADNADEIVLSKDILSKCGFLYIERLIGERISFAYDNNGQTISLIENAIIVGIIDDKIKNISWFESSQVGVCFTKLNDKEGGNYIFCELKDKDNIINKLNNSGIETYYLNNTPKAIEEVEKIGEFISKVLGLTGIVFLISYVLFQVAIIKKIIMQKTNYIFAMRALGFTRSNVIGILLCELAFLSIISVIIAIPICLGVYHLITNILLNIFGIGLVLQVNTFFIGILLSFIMLLLIILMNILIIIIFERNKVNN